MSPKVPGGSGRAADERASAALEGLSAVAAALDEPHGRATFMRGITLGALAGAALVGAVLQLRRTTKPPRSR